MIEGHLCGFRMAHSIQLAIGMDQFPYQALVNGLVILMALYGWCFERLGTFLSTKKMPRCDPLCHRALYPCRITKGGASETISLEDEEAGVAKRSVRTVHEMITRGCVFSNNCTVTRSDQPYPLAKVSALANRH